ncbi:MAG: hypothetical protein ACLUIX_02070, partial [Oscillospiraceae bacterium]
MPMAGGILTFVAITCWGHRHHGAHRQAGEALGDHWGITLAGVMLTVVAASILFSMAVYPAAIEAELPMVAVATAISPSLGTVYGIVLLLSMFCNALASLVAMLTYMEQKQAVFRKHKKLTLAAAAVLSWIGSLAGFGDLISVIFPVFGYLSVVFLVCM